MVELRLGEAMAGQISSFQPTGREMHLGDGRASSCECSRRPNGGAGLRWRGRVGKGKDVERIGNSVFGLVSLESSIGT